MQTEMENKSESFVLHDPEAVYEAAFQACWDHLADNAVLTAVDGTKIQIISRGEWNHEAGPDFKNAKIRYQGEIVRGDIELHRKSADYIRHGHLADAAYDRVILHVAEENDLTEEQASALAHIPLCCVSPASLDRRAGTACRCRIFPYMPKDQLRRFFADAGLERIDGKSVSILETLIRSGSGAAFRQVLFRAAGYKRNQEEFLELLHRVEQYPQEIFEAHFEALLWGESSLLPDPANTGLPEEIRIRVRQLWDEFWSFRMKAYAPICWQRDSVRPLNSPERRVAMLAAFLRGFSTDPLPRLAGELKQNEPEIFLRNLREKMKLSDPFWDRHCTFSSNELERKAAVLGSDRAEILLIDVIAPSLLAYAKLDSRKLPEQKAAVLPLLIHARKNNQVVKAAMRRWFPDPDAASQFLDNAAAVQGCLHVYKTYCAGTAGDCLSCLLANSVH